jgi:RNA polymerase sigma-70 factor, ECF subfamily
LWVGTIEECVQPPDESLLIKRAQHGDRGAFAVLVDRYWVRIFRWIYGLCERWHLAEDLTQDVFLKAWAALAQFQSGTSFRAWLFRIAGNALIDTQRGPRAAPPAPLPETVMSAQPNPVQMLLGQECATLVKEAVARLPESFRAAFLLRTQEELSYAEIAEALDITEETARWRLFKARQVLLRELGPDLDENP